MKTIQIQLCLFDGDGGLSSSLQCHYFESIQIENDQIENPSTKELTAWLLSKLHAIRQLKCRLKMLIQTEHFRESSCKQCKTAILVEKHLAAFFGLPLWGFGDQVLHLL